MKENEVKFKNRAKGRKDPLRRRPNKISREKRGGWRGEATLVSEKRRYEGREKLRTVV